MGQEWDSDIKIREKIVGHWYQKFDGVPLSPYCVLWPTSGTRRYAIITLSDSLWMSQARCYKCSELTHVSDDWSGIECVWQPRGTHGRSTWNWRIQQIWFSYKRMPVPFRSSNLIQCWTFWPNSNRTRSSNHVLDLLETPGCSHFKIYFNQPINLFPGDILVLQSNLWN